MAEIVELVPPVKARHDIGNIIAGNLMMRYTHVNNSQTEMQVIKEAANNNAILPWGHSNNFCVDNSNNEGHIVLVRPLTAAGTVENKTAYTIDWEAAQCIAIHVKYEDYVDEAREVSKIVKNIADKNQQLLKVTYIMIKKMW